jgi:hypothetical protein
MQTGGVKDAIEAALWWLGVERILRKEKFTKEVRGSEATS